jgi:hypothetical protein
LTTTTNVRCSGQIVGNVMLVLLALLFVGALIAYFLLVR